MFDVAVGREWMFDVAVGRDGCLMWQGVGMDV